MQLWHVGWSIWTSLVVCMRCTAGSRYVFEYSLFFIWPQARCACICRFIWMVGGQRKYYILQCNSFGYRGAAVGWVGGGSCYIGQKMRRCC